MCSTFITLDSPVKLAPGSWYQFTYKKENQGGNPIWSAQAKLVQREKFLRESRLYRNQPYKEKTKKISLQERNVSIFLICLDFCNITPEYEFIHFAVVAVVPVESDEIVAHLFSS